MKATTLSLLTALLVTSCAHRVGRDLAPGEEKDIALKSVPNKVLRAAAKAKPGFVASSAELEKDDDGRVVYELEGRAPDGLYEIEVTPDGRVVEVDRESK